MTEQAADQSAEQNSHQRAGGEGVRPPRLASLDAFRGLTILGMLLVNNIALDTATPAQFMHAEWGQGVRFADLVFPWFLFIVGVAIPFSAAGHRAKGLPARRYLWKAVARTISLLALGCLVDSALARQPVLGLGVLQLIGLAYLVGAVLYATPWWVRALVAGTLLVGHWGVLRFAPVAGLGTGSFSEHANGVQHLNDVYLAPLHLKGLISLAPTAALVLVGTTVGDLIRLEAAAAAKKAVWLVGGGLALVGIAWLWNLDLLYSKPLWTASYILHAAGLGSVALGVLYLVIDGMGWRRWAYPLAVLGSNAIVAYVAPILVKVWILQSWTWRMPDGSSLPLQQAYMTYLYGHAGRLAGGWLYTLSYIGFWWVVLLWMHRRKIFLRV